MNKYVYAILGSLALALVGAGAWLWRQGQPPPEQPAPVATAPPTPPAAASSEPGIKHPIQSPDAAAQQQVPALQSVDAALAELFGRKTVLSMFQPDDFPRRFVATIDNLGRGYAPARLWPVNPTGGRLVVEWQGNAEVIGAGNESRYTPYVLLIETVDLRQAATIYARLYPLFQSAYTDLGFPKGYFNDRLVEVIDQLLATPEVNGPLKVHLPSIKGPVQPERPWVLYEFDDPALQALSAGQKLLLRTGPVNQRRIKARLAEFRQLVTAAVAPR